MIDTSPKRQKELFLSVVTFSSDAEASAYNFYVRARCRWLTETVEGLEELMSNIDAQAIFHPMTQMLRNPDERQAKALAFTYNFMAEMISHTAVRNHFREVWGNRKTPEYDPPWEEAFTLYCHCIPENIQREMSE